MTVSHIHARLVAGFLALLVSMATVGGCGDAVGLDYGGGQSDQTVDVGGRTREFIAYVPQGLTPGQPAPLLLVFHGVPMEAENMVLLTWFNAHAERTGTVVAYMQADGDGWVSVGAPPGAEPTGELGYVAAVIDRIDADVDIDRSRVYAAGFSNGGLFTQRLACQFADRIAGIGVVGATIILPVVQGCAPSRHIPVIAFQGDRDPSFPWGEIGASTIAALGGEQSAQFWADLNDCGLAHDVTTLPDLVDDATTVERWSWPGCPADGQVVFHHIVGGGHTWPGSPLNLGAELGAKSRDIDASRIMLDFLLQQRLGSGA
ncbi:MAG: PHB depolymerase family esterase [Gemmatimonadota bacterium]|nr:hypothetical protein [Gemmatimonadota bacterium]